MKPGLKHFFLIINTLLLFSASSFLFSQNDYGYNSVIKIGGDSNYPPFEYLAEGYIPTGFNVDIVRAVAKTMQLNIELVLEPWSDIRDKFDRAEVDMLEGIFYSDKRTEKYLFSAPYIIMNQAVFMRKDNYSDFSVTGMNGSEIIVQRNDIMHEYAVNNNITDKLVIVESPEEGLRLLASGKHDFLLTSRMVGLYWIKELNLKNITTGDNLVSYRYCFAVNKNNPELLASLNEGLVIIQQNGVYNEIYEKWFSRLDPDFYISKKIYKYFFTFLFTLSALILILFFWSKSLKKTVLARTAELEKEIEEHRQSELELDESRELYKTLFSDFTDAFILYDSKSGSIIKYNKKACELYGLSEEDFRKIRINDFFKPVNRELAEKHLENVILTGFDTYETEFLKNGRDRKFLIIKSKKMLISGRELIQTIAIDITEKKQLEEKLVQAGKLEAVGTLAGGIAHDFNNILAAIIGYSELAMISIGKGNPGWDEINEILKAGNRAKDIVRQILMFRPQRQS